MTDWRSATLHDLVRLQRGHDLTADQRTTGDYPVLGSAGASGTHGSYIAKGPGVVIGRSGASFGQVHYCSQNYWPHNTVLYVTDFQNNDRRFAYYCLKSIDFSRYNSGSVQQSLNRNYIYAVPVLIPPIREQRAIAATLSALDDKIEANQQLNETLESIALAIFKDWFIDFGPTRFKMEGRGPYLSPETWALFPDRLGIDEMPVSWRMVKVADIAEKVAMGPFGSNIKVSTFIDDGIPVVSGHHLRSTMMEDHDFNYVTSEHADRLKSANVFRGDVVFTHAGNIGQVSYIPETSKYTRYVLSQRQFYLRCNRKLVSPTFVVYFFRAPEGQHKLLANASSTGVPSISRPATNLKAIEICLPSKEILDVFDAFVLECHRKIAANLAENITLAAIRDLLLSKFFSGEISVKSVEGTVEATL
jgi:type I restriction enzyme S subunit